MNKYMHHRNIYRNPPDFKKLADNYPQFLNICRLVSEYNFLQISLILGPLLKCLN